MGMLNVFGLFIFVGLGSHALREGKISFA